jgi:hypothetical protein
VWVEDLTASLCLPVVHVGRHIAMQSSCLVERLRVRHIRPHPRHYAIQLPTLTQSLRPQTTSQLDLLILIDVDPSAAVSVLKSSHFIPNQPKTESPHSFIWDIILSISSLPTCCMRVGRVESARRTCRKRGSVGGRVDCRYL